MDDGSGLMVVEMKAILQHTVHLCSTAPSESVNPSKKGPHNAGVFDSRHEELWSGLRKCQLQGNSSQLPTLNEERRNRVRSCHVDGCVSCWCCGNRDNPLLTSPNLQEKPTDLFVTPVPLPMWSTVEVMPETARHVRSSRCGSQERPASKKL